MYLVFQIHFFFFFFGEGGRAGEGFKYWGKVSHVISH